MPSPSDPAERARRLRAAIAYAGLSQKQASAYIGVSQSTLARMIGSKGGELKPPSWDAIIRFVESARDVPPAFFSADFERLQQIVPEGTPVLLRRSPSQSEAQERLRRAQAEAAQRTRERHDKPPGETEAPGAGERPS